MASLEIRVRTDILRYMDGRIAGVRIHVEGGYHRLPDRWLWLNRDTGILEEIEEHRALS